MRVMTPSRPVDLEFRPLAKAQAKPRATASFELVGADETGWQASSFDLAQGLDVKVMQSKLSAETLDRLFGS
jgi:hypothetical protein